MTRTYRLCVALFCWCFLTSVSSADQFRAGAAKRSIQPELPVGISGGMGAPSMASQAKGELTARAIAVSNGDCTIAICSVDVLGFPSVLCERVRAKVSGLPKENILIGATHTHSAPDCYAFPDGQGGHTANLSYIDFVVDQTASAIQSAIDSMQSATLRIASGKAEGKIAYNYYAPTLYDQRMGVIQTVNKKNQPIFTLVNYALHPEVLGSDAGIVSPDLVGPLCQSLEAGGGMGIFMNGAQGGMVTADNRRLDQLRDPNNAVWNDERSWEECVRIGELMASEAARLLQSATNDASPALKCDCHRVTFPIDSDILWQVFTQSPLGYSANRNERTLETQLNVITLGNCQIATIPGEALPNIGFFLKRKMSGQHQFLFGLTNDAFGYILTQVDYESFPRYSYVSRVCMGEMTGEILIENLLEMFRRHSQ